MAVEGTVGDGILSGFAIYSNDGKLVTPVHIDGTVGSENTGPARAWVKAVSWRKVWQ